MIRSILLGMMGSWGAPVLDFYETNSLWINSLVVIYGIVIVLSWVNLKNIRKSLILSLITQLRSEPDFAPDSPTEKALDSLTIPWENVIQKMRFPLIAQQNDLVPHRISLDAVQAMLPSDHLTKEAVKVLRLQKKRAAGKRSSKQPGK